MTSRRRGTYWATFSEGAVKTALPAGTVSRLFLLSTREAEVGREYEGYTVTRMIFNLFLLQQSDVESPASCGIILQNTDIALADIEPASDQFADWLWWEEFLPAQTSAHPMTIITRDIHSQRKARGADTDLYFYIVNRGTTTLEVHRSGRVLLKRA